MIAKPLSDPLALPGLSTYPRSVVELDGAIVFLTRGPNGKSLGVLGCVDRFEGERHGELLLGSLSPANAACLRDRVAWLRPRTLGLVLSVGCGDRLGLATPGHIQAVRRFPGIAPVFAQQSMRENARTGRTPQQVIDDAMWGVFQEGWREPWGADADHLKTTADVDLCVAAGYTFFTVDPGDHVDNSAHTASVDVLRGKLSALPWCELYDSPESVRGRYLDRTFDVGNVTVHLDEVALLRASCKYGSAVAHTAAMYRHLLRASENRPFELEVSVDETETPTSPEEHFFVASELRRLGVRWVSLAPRYVGRFEKGVDYIGDRHDFEREFTRHAGLARALGPYKLSMHSGSDKFTIYPIVASHGGGLVHLKTAGTSYLEALRAVAQTQPGMFREILDLARRRYAADSATYHVSADVAAVPPPHEMADSELAGLLDTFDARQMLHVTFGSVLDRYGSELLAILDASEGAHYTALETHFAKHLAPFAQASDR